MKLSHVLCLSVLFAVGCGGAIAQDLGSSDSGTSGDSAIVHPTNGRDGGTGGYQDAGFWYGDASHLKDAARTDANPSFPCGELLVCDRDTQVCKIGEGGPVGALPTYACGPIPPACLSDLTCDCMKKEVSANACSITNGAITIEYFYP